MNAQRNLVVNEVPRDVTYTSTYGVNQVSEPRVAAYGVGETRVGSYGEQNRSVINQNNTVVSRDTQQRPHYDKLYSNEDRNKKYYGERVGSSGGVAAKDEEKKSCCNPLLLALLGLLALVGLTLGLLFGLGVIGGKGGSGGDAGAQGNLVDGAAFIDGASYPPSSITTETQVLNKDNSTGGSSSSAAIAGGAAAGAAAAGGAAYLSGNETQTVVVDGASYAPYTVTQ